MKKQRPTPVPMMFANCQITGSITINLNKYEHLKVLKFNIFYLKQFCVQSFRYKELYGQVYYTCWLICR